MCGSTLDQLAGIGGYAVGTHVFSVSRICREQSIEQGWIDTEIGFPQADNSRKSYAGRWESSSTLAQASLVQFIGDSFDENFAVKRRQKIRLAMRLR
jgi:hypothetical protein